MNKKRNSPPPPCPDCTTSRCSDSGCSVTLPQGAVCISGSLFQAHHDHATKLCDCIILITSATQHWGAVVELKSGSLDARAVKEQLQSGANLAALHLGSTARLVPVLAHNGIHAMETRVIKKERIKFRGQGARIALLRCGSPLQDLLS